MAEMEIETRIDTLLKTATTDAANALLEIAESAANKDEKKAAKRALYLLSQKGIAPNRPSVPAPTAAPKTAASQTVEFFMSNADGAGNQMLNFILSEPDGGRPTLVNLIASDDEGITKFLAGKMARPDIDAQFATMATSYGARLAELPVDYGRWLVAQRREINRQQRKPTPRGFMELLPRIGEPEQQYESPPLEGLPSIETLLADETYSRDPAALFAEPGFERWFLNMAQVLPELAGWMKTLAEKSDDGPDEIQNRRQAMMRQITANIMTEPERNRYASSLQMGAVVLWKNGDEETAKQSLYHANELRTNAEPEGFVLALVQRTMDAARELLTNAMQGKDEG